MLDPLSVAVSFVHGALKTADDAKMFFALTNAMFDASIAVWDCKRVFDYVRPITAIRFLMAGVQIRPSVAVHQHPDVGRKAGAPLHLSLSK